MIKIETCLHCFRSNSDKVYQDGVVVSSFCGVCELRYAFTHTDGIVMERYFSLYGSNDAKICWFIESPKITLNPDFCFVLDYKVNSTKLPSNTPFDITTARLKLLLNFT